MEIPTPGFVIFYNGQEEQPDRQELKLSDMFSVHTEDPNLELKVTMININRGHNQKLLAACKTLGDYAEYTARVREYAKVMPLEEAVERAITECIRENILAEFLKKNRAEAKRVSIYEYDEEKHMRQTREEGYEQGREDGFKLGHEDGFKSGCENGFREAQEVGLKALVEVYCEIGLTEEECCSKILDTYHMPQEQAMEYIKKYWKRS